MYITGLRIGDAVHLPVTAVDAKTMVLRVIGKGNKERILPINQPLLYGECCPKCGSEHVRLIGKSERVVITYEEVQRGMFGWLMTLIRGDP
jgi:hypothetical protein